MSDDTFHRPEEVARKCKMSLPAVYKWVREGQLPAYKLGKCVRVHVDDLEEFLRQRRKGGR
jgi:excisionase family DNA binding protein